MNNLSMINIQQGYNPEVFYSELIVDGVLLSEWLAEYIDKSTQLKRLDVKELGLSLNLDLYSDTKIVWYYLGQLGDGNISYVPLLVCPEDNDLSCTTIATEQYIIDDKVVWKRFGLLTGSIEKQNPDAIDWFDTVPELTFAKDNFEKVFSQFMKDFTEAYQHRDEFVDINFPTNFCIS